jgi:hypothetical protein
MMAMLARMTVAIQRQDVFSKRKLALTATRVPSISVIPLLVVFSLL